MRNKVYLYVSSLIFGVVALAHLLRVVNQWPVQVNAFAVPQWVSWPGLVVAGVLCIWGITLARR